MTDRDPRNDARKVCTFLGVCLVVAVLMVVFFRIVTSRASHQSDKNDLKQIGLALFSYSAQRGHYPPAGEPPKDTQPACSWRVSILPYMGRTDMYEAYDLTRPWNAPPNDEWTDVRIDEYCGTFNTDAQAFIKFAAITGDGTVWDPSETYRTLPESTIIAVQVSGSDIQWAEPRDLSLSPLQRLVETGGQDVTIGEANIGPLVLFADVGVLKLSERCPLDRLLKLVTIQGAKEHDRRELLKGYIFE